MTTSTVVELPYNANSELLFEKIRHLQWPIFLDSSHCTHSQARYDVIAAQPDITLVTNGDITTIVDCRKIASIQKKSELSHADPMELVETHFNEWKKKRPIMSAEIPILPGIYGFLSYDFSRRLEAISSIAKRDIALPELACGIYGWIVLVDHHLRKTLLVNASDTRIDSLKKLFDIASYSPESNSASTSPMKTDQTHSSEEHFTLAGEWRSNLPFNEYQKAFNKSLDYITQGDSYQINLTHRLENKFHGHPWTAYQKLRQLNPNPFSAYFDIGQFQILSLSPEQFIQVKGCKAKTRPIKGTMPRGVEPDSDQLIANKLQLSEKNRAENLMIVDLMRNDFNKQCLPHSVKVPLLFELESFPTVHHLVSTIIGELPLAASPLQLMKSCFPGGSITGAPKIRTMNIIDELEPNRRSIYCGSLFYLDIANRLDSNITIRTLLCVQSEAISHNNISHLEEKTSGSIYCWAGGGIVADSVAQEEYQETYDKINGLLKALQNNSTTEQ